MNSTKLSLLDAGLDRLETSRSFKRSANQLRLLRFLLKQAEDHKGSLKETYIGSVFYSRPATYDPQLDSIVRVNVSRLRSRLQEYYETEGRNDPLRIEIPVGSYVPELRTVSDAVSEVLSPTEREVEGALAVVDDRPSLRLHSLWIWAVPGLLSMAVAAGLIVHFAHTRSSRLTIQLKQKWLLTPGHDTEIEPALSPDGRQMAYVSRVAGDAHLRIFLRPYELTMMTGQPLNTGDGDVLYPAWSPDGKQLAFVHCGSLSCEMELYRFLDARVQKVRSIPAFGLNDNDIVTEIHNPRPVWTSDGKALLFPASDEEDKSLRLIRHDLATGQETQLIPGSDGGEDIAAALSPDGRSLGYLHRNGENTDVRTFDLVTQKVQIVSTGWPISVAGLTWAPNGQSLVISSSQGENDAWTLWDVPLSGTPAQIPVPLTKPIYPTFTPDGKQLLVLSLRDNQNLALADDRDREKTPSTIFRSEIGNVTAEFSPDGTEVAQLIAADDHYEVWISSVNNGNLSPRRQLTHGLNIDHIKNMSWSPDGKTLAISTLMIAGIIHLVDTSTGAITRLNVPDLKEDFLQSPAWAPDSKSIYVGTSARHKGIYQIFLGPVPTVKEILVCSVRDLQMDSVGSTIYFERRRGGGVFRVRLKQAPKAEPIPELAAVRASRNWKIADGGLYYLDLHDAVPNLRRYDLKTGKITIASGVLPRPAFQHGGLAYSPHNHLIIYSQFSEDSGSQIVAFPVL